MMLFIGALLGFIAVAFGAYAEHGLRPEVSAEAFRSVMTAIRYNQVHAVAVVALGLFLARSPASGTTAAPAALSLAAWLLAAGTVLFSFAIYLAVLWNMPSLTAITPLGGILLMTGWLALAWGGLRHAAGGGA